MILMFQKGEKPITKIKKETGLNFQRDMTRILNISVEQQRFSRGKEEVPVI